jgi:hypothetical protein
LGSLDLRRKNRFLSDIEIEKEGRVWEKKRESIETPHGSVGMLQEIQINVQGRVRRQSKRDKRLEAFRSCGLAYEFSLKTAIHDPAPLLKRSLTDPTAIKTCRLLF